MTTTLEQIQEFARRLGEEFSPQRVILFGSYAYGQPTPDSDVDLLVIVRSRFSVHPSFSGWQWPYISPFNPASFL